MNIDHLLSSYTYELPDNTIAQHPTLPEHDAKMLVLSA